MKHFRNFKNSIGQTTFIQKETSMVGCIEFYGAKFFMGLSAAIKETSNTIFYYTASCRPEMLTRFFYKKNVN